ncbi:MAG: hypothetical protein ACYC7L_06435 [Nitrospirota bacterium]
MQQIAATFRASGDDQRALFRKTLDVLIDGLPGYVKGLDSKSGDVARMAFHVIEDELTYIFASFSNPTHV